MQAVESFGNPELHQSGNNNVGTKSIMVNPRRLSGDFKQSSSLIVDDDLHTQQVVFANAFEHDFYVALTTCKQDYRFHTFFSYYS